MINVADTVTGAQIGVINIANVSTGAQIGVINLANHSTAPLGLLSLVRHGRASIGVFASDFTLLGVEARAGSEHLFTQVRAGATPWLVPGATLPVASLGVGTAIALRDDIAIDLEGNIGFAGLNPFSSVGTRVRWRALPLLTLSAGPELRVLDAHGLHLPTSLAVGPLALSPGIVIGVGL